MSVNNKTGERDVRKRFYRREVSNTVNRYKSEPMMSTKGEEIYYFGKVQRESTTLNSSNDSKSNESDTVSKPNNIQLTADSNVKKLEAMAQINQELNNPSSNSVENSLSDEGSTNLKSPQTAANYLEKDHLKSDNWRLLSQVFTLKLQLNKAEQRVKDQKKEMNSLLEDEREKYKKLMREFEETKSKLESAVDNFTSQRQETEMALEAEREKSQKLIAELEDLKPKVEEIHNINVSQRNKIELLLGAEQEKSEKLMTEIESLKEKIDVLSELNFRLQKSILYYSEKFEKKETNSSMQESTSLKEQIETIIHEAMKSQRILCTIL